MNRGSQGVKRERKEVKASVILTAFAKRFSCDENELLAVKRGSGVDNTARALAMKLCQEYGSMKLAEIGELFGAGSDSGVTKTISRLTLRLLEDATLTERFIVLCRDLTP